MSWDRDSAVALLARTPGVLGALLTGLASEWLESRESADGWSVREVACHLADLERDAWLPRLRAILEKGADAPLPGIERERFRTTYGGVAIAQVLNDFERLRADNLRTLAEIRLAPEQLDAVGRHAVLGEVRASHLLSAWVVHDLTHQAQIARALAARYREAVGPWREYLSVLGPRGERS